MEASIFLLQPRHLLHIQAVEGRMNMEKEYPENEGRDQDVKGNAQFHHQGHAPTAPTEHPQGQIIFDDKMRR